MLTHLHLQTPQKNYGRNKSVSLEAPDQSCESAIENKMVLGCIGLRDEDSGQGNGCIFQ